ncbi:MAG: acylneuraminate cytidylyltransferase, partial [Thiotrichales bacterium]|nr:acylneuraminate cytidylyltransferase [Thiotrichales bacterium]
MGNVKVLGVISARLNSSRLPAKQLLPLAGETMVGRLFQRLEKITLVDQWVLATTADDYNVPLVEWATAAQKSVFAYLGDVSDLVGRIDAIYRQY